MEIHKYIKGYLHFKILVVCPFPSNYLKMRATPLPTSSKYDNVLIIILTDRDSFYT